MDAGQHRLDVLGSGCGDDIDLLFGVAYERHRAALLRQLRAWTRDESAAEDICQDAYIRLYGALRDGHGPEDAGAWLRRVGRNLAISRARRTQVALRNAGRLREAAAHDPTATIVLEREHVDGLRAALGRIPDEQRELLLLAASGYTRGQIGTRVGASAGAVRTRLHRARRLLMGELEVSDPTP
jgi:RNA polymerase sigma factor (sigma-70 family)